MQNDLFEKFVQNFLNYYMFFLPKNCQMAAAVAIIAHISGETILMYFAHPWCYICFVSHCCVANSVFLPINELA